jgi:hypothetical protein
MRKSRLGASPTPWTRVARRGSERTVNLRPMAGGIIGVVAGSVSGDPLRGALIGAALTWIFPPPYACAGPPENIVGNAPYSTFLSYRWIGLGAAIGIGAGAGASLARWALAAGVGTAVGVVVLMIDAKIMSRQCRRLRKAFEACVNVTNGWTEERAKEYTERSLSRLSLSRIIEPP